MSRSYKKPWVTDNNSSHENKKLSSRVVRRTIKQKVNYYCKNYETELGCYGCDCMDEVDIFDDWNLAFLCKNLQKSSEPILPLREELYNSYDICDFRFYIPAHQHWGSPKGYTRK